MWTFSLEYLLKFLFVVFYMYLSWLVPTIWIVLMATVIQGFTQDDICIGILSILIFSFLSIKKVINLFVGPCPCKFEVGIVGKINGEAENIIVDEKHRKSRQQFRLTRITVKYWSKILIVFHDLKELLFRWSISAPFQS